MQCRINPIRSAKYIWAHEDNAQQLVTDLGPAGLGRIRMADSELSLFGDAEPGLYWPRRGAVGARFPARFDRRDRRCDRRFRLVPVEADDAQTQAG